MMNVGVVQVAMALQGSRSLKEKRQQLQSLRDRLKQRFNVSVAEVDSQDACQRAVMGVALVGSELKGIRRTLQSIRGMIETNPELSVIEYLEEIV